MIYQAGTAVDTEQMLNVQAVVLLILHCMELKIVLLGTLVIIFIQE